MWKDIWEDVVDLAKEVGLFSLVCVAIFLFVMSLIIGGSIFTASKSCSAYSEQTNLETTFDAWGGCFVHTDSGVKHVNELRYETK